MLDTQVRWLPVEQIAPNPHQPRREFAPGPLAELAESIRRHGIIQPLSVRRRDDGWELIAGERRLRAAKLAGLQTVPCLEMQVDEQDSAILALIEISSAGTCIIWRKPPPSPPISVSPAPRRRKPPLCWAAPPPLWPISCACCGSPLTAAACSQNMT